MMVKMDGVKGEKLWGSLKMMSGFEILLRTSHFAKWIKLRCIKAVKMQSKTVEFSQSINFSEALLIQ